jgi:hypothetical protein
LIKRHVNYAQKTGDYSALYNYLQAFPKLKAIAQRNIKLAEVNKLNNPYPMPDMQETEECLSGSIWLGKVNLYGGMFGIHPNEFCTPTMIMGQPGSGKSVLNKSVVAQHASMPSVGNIIIPDHKKEYRDIISRCENLHVITEDNVRINFLQVPDWCHPMDHLISFAKNFVRMNYLVGTSENALIDIIEYLYRERGVFDGSRNYPTILDLYRYILARLKTIKSFRLTDVYEWLKNRLKPYTLMDNFAFQFGIPFEYFINKNMVLELDQKFSDMQFSLINAHLAKQIYDYNKKKRLIGSKLRTLFLVDEARILFDANRDASVFGENPLNEIVSKGREFGLGFIVCSQEAASFNQVIRSLARLRIAFPLSDGKDLDFIEKSFGLNKEQKQFISTLPRQAVAVVSYSGFERPFLIEVPQFQTPKPMSDADVRLRMSDFYAELARNIKRPAPSQPLQAQTNIPPDSASLLYFLSKEPFTKVSAMTNAPGFKSPAEVRKALDWLEKSGFVKREQHRVSRRGRKSVFGVLTPKAYKYLDKKGIPGKGRFEHKLAQNLICRKLEKDGLQAKIEGRVSGFDKSMDVLSWSKDGDFLAYEVTLHFENLLSNLRSDLESGVSKVFIVTRDRVGMERAQKIVHANPEFGDNVEFMTIDAFFD